MSGHRAKAVMRIDKVGASVARMSVSEIQDNATGLSVRCFFVDMPTRDLSGRRCPAGHCVFESHIGQASTFATKDPDSLTLIGATLAASRAMSQFGNSGAKIAQTVAGARDILQQGTFSATSEIMPER
jgi:hypothetical protein